MNEGLISVANRIDRIVGLLCRIAIIAAGIALTVVMTANVVARYIFASGGFDFAQELPTLIFPWFIVAGIALAAQAGAHMAVEWLYDKLQERGKAVLFIVGNCISITAFIVLAYQSMVVADIAGIEHSPVLNVPNSIGYYAVAAGAVLVAIVTATATLRVAAHGWDARPQFKVEELPL